MNCSNYNINFTTLKFPLNIYWVQEAQKIYKLNVSEHYLLAKSYNFTNLTHLF